MGRQQNPQVYTLSALERPESSTHAQEQALSCLGSPARHRTLEHREVAALIWTPTLSVSQV